MTFPLYDLRANEHNKTGPLRLLASARPAGTQLRGRISASVAKQPSVWSSRLMRSCVDDAHGHPAQAVIEPPLAENRPPVVEEDLKRPPHGDPAADHEALAQHRGQGTLVHRAGDHLAR